MKPISTANPPTPSSSSMDERAVNNHRNNKRGYHDDDYSRRSHDVGSSSITATTTHRLDEPSTTQDDRVFTTIKSNNISDCTDKIKGISTPIARKSTTDTASLHHSQHPDLMRHKQSAQENNPIVIDLSNEEIFEQSEGNLESELDKATRNMNESAKLSFLFNFVDKSDRNDIPSYKKLPNFDFSPIIPVERVIFGSLPFDRENLNTVEKSLTDLSIRFVGHNQNVILFTIVDIDGKPVVERVKFQHIKSMHKYVATSGNEVVFALVPKNDISLSYLTAGYGSDHVIYPQATKHELKNILIVVDHKHSNILEQYLLRSKEGAFVTCDKKFVVHFNAYLYPEICRDRESIIDDLIVMKCDEAFFGNTLPARDGVEIKPVLNHDEEFTSSVNNELILQRKRLESQITELQTQLKVKDGLISELSTHNAELRLKFSPDMTKFFSTQVCDDALVSLDNARVLITERRKHLVSDEELCVICMFAKRDTVLVPCGHLKYCWECVSNLKKKVCPCCNMNYQNSMRVYTS